MTSTIKSLSFFINDLPKRLSSATELIKNIENDLREPISIRRESRRVERLVKPIYGKVMHAFIDIFGEKSIKNNVSNIHKDGEMIIARLSYKDSIFNSAVKKFLMGESCEGDEDGLSYLADISAFRSVERILNVPLFK